MESKYSFGPAAVASGVTLALVFLVACPTQTDVSGPGGGDEPVVMAGGSMRFITTAHSFDPNPMDPHKMTHNKKTKKMTQADILFSVSDAPAFQTVALNNPQNTIAIDYCTGVVQGGTCTGTTETVTIQSDNSGNGIEINSPNRVIPPSNSNVVEFPPPPGRISKIRINTQGFECPSAGNGNCLLVIHYK